MPSGFLRQVCPAVPRKVSQKAMLDFHWKC